MSRLQLTKLRMQQGVWEGLVSGAPDQPDISVLHLGDPVENVELIADGDNWRLRVPIPERAIADGVQTLLIINVEDQQQLGHITLLAGDVLGDDIRAEIDLLRAELDTLKRAFRRHCLETGAGR